MFGPFKSDDEVITALYAQGWFRDTGAYVLVDGQFGSTGKGLAASVLAALTLERPERMVDWVVSNAGPNSGHTAVVYNHGAGAETKWVNCQLPIVSSILDAYGHTPKVWLNGGAVIDPAKLYEELATMHRPGQVFIHPHAAVIGDAAKDANRALTAQIASTGKGTQPAAALRILRQGQVYDDLLASEADPTMNHVWPSPDSAPLLHDARVLIETSQGMSLGINSGFYPFCTHRECTVSQALSDARLPPQFRRKTMVVLRTFPIRVGNTEGSSGPGYSDQKETTWEAIGQTPEITTVTKRVRRVFTWSRQQFRECLRVNWPDTILLNFMNYLPVTEGHRLLQTVREDIRTVMGEDANPLILTGWGPFADDVRLAHI